MYFFLTVGPNFTRGVTFVPSKNLFIGDNVTFGGCQFKTRFINLDLMNVSLWQGEKQIIAYNNVSLDISWNGDGFNVSTKFHNDNYVSRNFSGRYYCQFDYWYGTEIITLRSEMTGIEVKGNFHFLMFVSKNIH